MFKKFSKLMAVIFATVILVSSVCIMDTTVSYAGKSNTGSVTVVDVQMFTTSGTPVYAVDDMFSSIVTYLDRFTPVRVTGITQSGFYRVDIGGTFYIPGPYLVLSIKEDKTAKQIALDNLDKLTEAYVNQLKQMTGYENSSFALLDVTGDGVPELISGDDSEIYTYYNERAVMIYYGGENPTTLYYSKNDNKLLGKYTWNSNTIWEVYNLDTSLFAWGQFKCVSTDASSYKENASEIEKSYTNNDETRSELYDYLKEILSL